MRSGIRKKWDNLNNKVEASYHKYSETKAAKLRLKRMNGGYDCTKEYNEIVVPYWKKYGLKPKKMWYQIFWDRDHTPDPRYIPDSIYYEKILPYFSNPLFRRFGEDKCMHGVWMRDLKRPETLMMNCAGVYYGDNFEVITREEAVERCLSADEVFVKPSIDSGEGRLIRFFDKESMTREALEKCFDDFDSNFIAQRAIKQHPTLAALNSSSLNTIRIVSFFFKNEVHILSAILRVGAKGSKVDNIGAGGYACAIHPNGELNDKGVNRKAEWVEKTNEGVAFAGVTVPAFDRIVAQIKTAHKKLPHFKIIGWDFCVDTEGDPVFIEYNFCSGINQITCGPAFGDLTEEVLDEVFIHKTLQNSQN